MQLSSLHPDLLAFQQLEQGAKYPGEVVLINRFTLLREHEAAFLDLWTKDAGYMKSQDGLNKAQLHKALDDGAVPHVVYVNVAEWESIGHFKAAFTNPEFQATLQQYPPCTIQPTLFEKVSIGDIC